MAGDIAKHLLRTLAAADVVLSEGALKSLLASYQRRAEDAVNGYYALSPFNGLVFQRHEEEIGRRDLRARAQGGRRAVPARPARRAADPELGPRPRRGPGRRRPPPGGRRVRGRSPRRPRSASLRRDGFRCPPPRPAAAARASRAPGRGRRGRTRAPAARTKPSGHDREGGDEDRAADAEVVERERHEEDEDRRVDEARAGPRPREPRVHGGEEDAPPREGRRPRPSRTRAAVRSRGRNETTSSSAVFRPPGSRAPDADGQRDDDGGPERDGRRDAAGGALRPAARSDGHGSVADPQHPEDEREESAEREADRRPDGERAEEDDGSRG